MAISAFRVGRDGTEGGLPAATPVRYRDAYRAWQDCARTLLSVSGWGQGTAGAVHPCCRRRSTALQAAYRLALGDGADGSLRSRRQRRDDARVESVLSLDCLSIRRCPAMELTAGRRRLHGTDAQGRYSPCYISKYPPAEPVALRLLAPQRGLFATVRSKSKNKSKSLELLSSLP